MVNKLDRLVLELRMSPGEAYARLQAVVGHCNMIWSGFESERWLSESDAVLALEAAKEAARDAAGRVCELCTRKRAAACCALEKGRSAPCRRRRRH
jgi:translation elongation factor EF-G